MKSKLDNYKTDVFTYINPNNNDKLSQMKGNDLQNILFSLDNFYLQLRDKLGFDKNITFGLELEFGNAKKKKINTKLESIFPNGEWRTKDDASLDNGAEISSPILTDNAVDWKQFSEVCSIVNNLASIDAKCGGHIHVGVQILGDDREAWLNFIKLWSIYENIIFRFVDGEFLTSRPGIKKYAVPMSRIFTSDLEELKNSKNVLEILLKVAHKRYQAVNFNNIDRFYMDEICNKNTIEFRCPNGTLNPVIWQNNVNLLINILLYAKSTSFDNDVISKRKEANSYIYNSRCDLLNLYNEIQLQQALELCDMLFNNNLDKLYFLRQYLKNFEVNPSISAKTKTFTR